MTQRDRELVSEEFLRWACGETEFQQVLGLVAPSDQLGLKALFELYLKKRYPKMIASDRRKVWQLVRRHPSYWEGVVPEHLTPKSEFRRVWMREQFTCLICGAACEFAHFPRAEKAGGSEERGLPLCRIHHRELDTNGKEFLWRHKEILFAFWSDWIRFDEEFWKWRERQLTHTSEDPREHTEI